MNTIFQNDIFFEEYVDSKYTDKSLYRETILEDGFSYSIFISPTIADIIEKKAKGRRYLIVGGFKQLLIIHFYYLEFNSI